MSEGQSRPFEHGEEDFLPMEPERAGGDDLFAGMAPPPPGVDALIAIAAPLYASPAIAALLAKRLDQALRHGHTPAADLARSPWDIARRAGDRVRDATEYLSGREPTPRKRLEQALVKVEAGGAMLLALHDRIRAELERLPRGEGE